MAPEGGELPRHWRSRVPLEMHISEPPHPTNNKATKMVLHSISDCRVARQVVGRAPSETEHHNPPPVLYIAGSISPALAVRANDSEQRGRARTAAMGLAKGVHLKCAHTDGRGAICYAPNGRCAAAGRPAPAARPPAMPAPAAADGGLAPAARRHILTCGEDTFVKIFESDNVDAEPRTLEHHDAPVTTLAIDGKVSGALIPALPAALVTAQRTRPSPRPKSYHVPLL